MNVIKNNQLLINCGLLIAIASLFILVGKLKPQDKPAIAEIASKVETVTEQEELPNNPRLIVMVNIIFENLILSESDI